MDGAEINYRRLLMLIDEAGGVASISRAVGHKTSSTLSQYKGRAADSKTGKPKRLGRGLVRDLEDACQKEHGWMDQPLNETEMIIYGPERYPYEVPHALMSSKRRSKTHLRPMPHRLLSKYPANTAPNASPPLSVRC